MAGRVSKAERRQAAAIDLDRSRLDRVGIQAAATIGFRAQAAGLRAMRAGRSPVPAMRPFWKQAIELLVEAMVAGHLAGRRRSALLTPADKTLALRNTPYTEAVGMLQARLRLPRERLVELGKQYEAKAVQVMEGATAAVERDLERVVAQSVASGAHVKEGVGELRKTFAKHGLVPSNSFTLEAIFRTQTQTAYGAGRWNADQSPEIQEILWGYKYVTVGDDRVRPEHVGYEGVTLAKDDPMWDSIWPPNGWACRCVTISIFEPRKTVPVPDRVEVDGKIVQPAVDDGFRFNPGKLHTDRIPMVTA